jgi:hypothetical protein
MLTIPLEQSRAAVVGPSAPTAPSLPQNPFASARVTAVGEETGFALMELGSQTRRLSRDMLHLAARAEERRDALMVQEKISTLGQYGLDLEKTLKENFRGGLAIGRVTRQGLQNFDDVAADLSGQLEKPRQKELFSRISQSMRLLLSRDLARYETGQQASHEEAVFRNTRSSLLEKAGLLGREGAPDRFEEMLPLLDNLVGQRFTGPEADAVRKDMETEFRSHFISSMSFSNPQGAALLLDQPAVAGRGFDQIREILGNKPLLWRHTVGENTVQNVENLSLAHARQQEEAIAARAAMLNYDLDHHLAQTFSDGQISPEAGNAINELSTLGRDHDEDARAWKSRFSYASRIWREMEGSKSLPFHERFKRLAGFGPKADDPYFRDKSFVLEAAGLQLNSEYAFFRRDPAGYAQAILETRGGEESFAGLSQKARTKKILALQREFGRKNPLVLPAQEKERLLHDLAFADPQGKTEILSRLKQYGDLETKVFDELDLSAAYRLAAGKDKYLAKTIIAAYDAAQKRSDHSSFEMEGLAKANPSIFWEQDQMGGIYSAIADATRNAKYLVDAKDLYLAFAEIALSTGSAAHAGKIMFDKLLPVNDRSILIGWLPKDLDLPVETVKGMLREARTEAVKKIYGDNLENPLALNLEEKGIFVPSADGKSLVLIEPNSGLAVRYPGKTTPFEVKPEDLFYKHAWESSPDETSTMSFTGKVPPKQR